MLQACFMLRINIEHNVSLMSDSLILPPGKSQYFRSRNLASWFIRDASRKLVLVTAYK